MIAELDARITTQLRRPTYRRLVAEGALKAGWAADDGAALVFEGTELLEAVSWEASAAAYRLERSADGYREHRLETRLLTA